MRLRKKRLGLTVLSLSLICAMSVSMVMAYFTDREQATATATAGTLNITLTESWDASNPARTNAKPGDIYNLDYTVTNEGNKSADVRETFVIRSSVAMSAAPEFEIYAASSVVKGSDGTYAPISGAKPVVNDSTTRKISADKKTITYSLPEFVLNGTGTAAETEPGVSSNARTFDYVILFSKTASNAFQGAEVTIDYLAEAKQHRNTNDSIWATVATEQITFAGGSVKAVPAA